MDMLNHDPKSFEWTELSEMFGMRSQDGYEEERKREILERVNRLADRYGKEYVAKRIALDV